MGKGSRNQQVFVTLDSVLTLQRQYHTAAENARTAAQQQYVRGLKSAIETLGLPISPVSMPSVKP
jgi:hypothetical protein